MGRARFHKNQLAWDQCDSTPPFSGTFLRLVFESSFKAEPWICKSFCIGDWLISADYFGRYVRTKKRIDNKNTNWNTHTYTLTYQSPLLFFLCQFGTLFESRILYWKLIVGILWIFWLICLLLWNTKLHTAPPILVGKYKPDAIFVFPAFFFPQKELWQKNWVKKIAIPLSFFLQFSSIQFSFIFKSDWCPDSVQFSSILI